MSISLRRGSHCCGLMLALRTMSPHLRLSALIMRVERLGRVADRLEAEPGELRATSSLCSASAMSRCSFCTIARRRAGAHDDAVPRGDVEARQAALGDGRHVGQLRRAPRARDRERDELAGLHVLQHRRDAGEHHLHVAAEQVVHRRRDALVRDVHRLDAGLDVQQLAGEVRAAAVARRREVELAGVRLRVGDQLA